MSKSTEKFSIICNIFDENYIIKKDIREDVDQKGENLIKYLEKLLNDCEGFIDKYLEENEFNI